MPCISAEDSQANDKGSIGNNDFVSLSFPLHQHLERGVESCSDKIAVVCANKTLTFGELNSLANRFARILVQQGVRHGDLVGVALDRSVDLVAVLLAVWKAGAAYVPIDPALPAERINQMMEDARPRVLFTGGGLLGPFESWQSICLNLDELQPMLEAGGDGSDLGVVVNSDDLAYVMYTSGSTGRPKGVEVSHGNVSNLLLSMQKEPGCNASDRLLAITTVSFDMAVLELFLPLMCRATTVIAQRHEVRDPDALLRLMERHTITIMQGTPAIWHMLLESGWNSQPHLHKIFCGGEALPRSLADRLLARADMVWNMYGPTEATVYASIWRVPQGREVLVGKSINNGCLYVLDDNFLPVPAGTLGELYIGGSGVAQGYRNNQELTRLKFLENPFGDGLMYRTGDLACFLASGELSVMGRLDGQVKLRGHRIELGDIEAAISENEDISGAVVLYRDDQLVAYCMKRTAPFRYGTEATTNLGRVLRLWLAERLPAYMVPAFFVEMQSFPVTINGKIDRKAFPNPVTALETPADTNVTTALENQILTIWSNVLGHSHVGIDDNFFEVGGDSLRVIRVQKELQRLLHCSVPSPKLFEYYTIRTLAAHLSKTADTTRHEMAREEIHGYDAEDIAIVSMACRLPGGVTNPEDLWELLERGGDAIIDVPDDRWNNDARYRDHPDTQGKPGRYRGGFVPSINSFDTSFFGIAPREARRLDPAQYMMLETCWEGFERAGYTLEQLRGSQTGVFIGTSNILAHQSLGANAITDLTDLDGYTVTGSSVGTMSGRISYQLGLEGPSMTIDTACSSSLVTTHLACNALRQGECDIAVSGGVSLMLNPGLHVEFSRLKGMSPDGRCRAFAADAEGTGWSEGSVVAILKRLSDAQRDGDSIQAVIRGTAVNHDGRSATLTTPSGSAQQRLVRSALTRARLRPNDIDYVEAHGTGTRLGDPIEATALAAVFGPSRTSGEPLWIGSIKSNIGHTQAAAGLVGLLKVILAIEHSSLPRTLYVTKPTPAVDWLGANMAPVQMSRPWPSLHSRLRRAGVSAFGIGGTNAHVIVEEPPRRAITDKDMEPSPRMTSAMPFLLSGDSVKALGMQAEKLHRHISDASFQDDLGDVSYSLATDRTHFRTRSVLIAGGKRDLLDQLESMACSKPFVLPLNDATEVPKLAMIFTGQGSQWLGMGIDLCKVYPIVLDTLNEIAAEFTDLEMPLLEVMWADPGSFAATMLDRTDFAQPALFALEVALWRLWQSWSVRPDFVLGHSLGELVAAHVAGILSLHDACRIVAARGRLMEAQSGNSRMVSLGANGDEVTTAIELMGYSGKVDIAAYNTPMQTVISGDNSAVESIEGYFARQGRRTKTLVIGHAFHSHQMDNMLAEFRVVIETVQFNPPQLSIISSVDGKLADIGQLEKVEYWIDQARRPVRFCAGIQELLHYGVNIFLELGPHRVLCGIGAACAAEAGRTSSIAWLPSLISQESGLLTIQRSAADLHLRHMPINWSAYFASSGCRRVGLPTYAFQRNYHVHIHDQTKPAATADVYNRPSSCTVPGSHGGSQFEVVWQSAQTDDVYLSGTWGLLPLADDVTWAGHIKTSLFQAGITLVEVKQLEDAVGLDGILCLWDSQAEVISQTRDFVSEALTQLQTAARIEFKPPLIWITHHAVGTGNESPGRTMHLGAAPLWGLMRTARNEHPELHLRLVDLDDKSSACTTSALMLRFEPECAVRLDQVLIPRLQLVESAPRPMPKNRLLRPDGAVLITGGLGNLGVRVARWLVGEHGVRDLVLTSRRGMQASGAHAVVAELSKSGTRVTVIACDIAKPESVESIMALFSKDRPLRGVVHTAGVVDSGILSAMTPERCETTLAPKVYGAWLLHLATLEMDMDMFVMFSSISGVMGMPGLANYAAANTFLDALAHLRVARCLPATSIAYGTWAGDGMASELISSTRSHLAHFGLDPLSPDKGLELFQQAVVSTRALTVVAALDLGRLEDYSRERGRIPPLLQSLFTEDTSREAREADLGQLLSVAEPRQHANIVLGMVREVVAKALGFRSPLDVEVDRPLQDIGIDSLTAVQMRNHLATVTGLTLSVNIAFLHPNLKALSETLLSQLQSSDASSTTTVSSSLTSATSMSSASPLDMEMILKGCLDSSLTFQNTIQDPSGVTRCPETVLLTGATGFVGASILYELLSQGIRTYCLVRADSIDEAQQRIVSTLQHYDVWEPRFAPLVNSLVGDMAQPLLGLTEEVFNDMADRVDAICHSGALVDWMRPLDDYVGPNIVSAHEVLRLASRGRAKAVHLVSTISTLPKHMGLDLGEGDQEYGYGTSKFIAERLMAAARWRGAKATVYRLPYVTASSTTGHFRLDRGDFLHNLIAGSLEMKAFPSSCADMSAVLPVDYLSRTIVAVMTRDPQRMGRDFDFLNTRAPTCNDFFQSVGAIGGGADIVTFSTWKQMALDYAMKHPTSSLARIIAVLDNYTDANASSIFKGLSVGEHVLGTKDYPAPPMDEKFIKAYLDCISKAG